MKDLLRKCYQGAGITGANAKLYENRVGSIQEILGNDDFWGNEDWELLTKWAIGAVEDTSVEAQLIDLEEAFCKTDDGFTNENKKELHILVEFLLCQYCKKTKNVLLPSIIICGHGVGWNISSSLVYNELLVFIDEMRLASRQLDQRIFTQVPLEPLKTTADEQDATGEAVEEQIDQIVDDLETVEEHLCDLAQQNQKLSFALSVQREESNILWWMLTEWSETAQKSYHDMSKMEAALLSAYELNGCVNFSLGPHASKQILMKMISLGKTEKPELSTVKALIDQLNGELLPSFEKCQITELQPILSALKAKRIAVQKGKGDKWQQQYEMACEKSLDDLLMTAFDFGQQLYLEIELGRQLHTESNGE